MASYTLIDLDGVLRRPTLAALDQGLTLFRGLSEVTNVVPVIDGDHDEARRWLGAHQLPEPPFVLRGNEALEHARTQLRLQVTLYVTAREDRALAALRAGVPAMLLAVPELARAEFAPDYERPKKAWSELTGEVQRQARLAAQVLDEGPQPA